MKPAMEPMLQGILVCKTTDKKYGSEILKSEVYNQPSSIMRNSVSIISALLVLSSCLIEDDYGIYKPEEDLGILLAENVTDNFLWKPNTNEIVYVDQGISGIAIKAVHIETKVQRTILSFTNAYIQHMVWKNNSYQDLIYFISANSGPIQVEQLNLASGQRQVLIDNTPGKLYNSPSIISNQKFLATRKYTTNNPSEQLTIRKWDDNSIIELGDFHPVVASPDFEQLIVANLNQWPVQYYLYAIETEDFFLLQSFNNYPADIVEWTPAGILGYIVRTNVYIRRNLSNLTEQQIRYDFPEQNEQKIIGSPSGNSFLYLMQICKNGRPPIDCNTQMISEIYWRDTNQFEAERVMLAEDRFLQFLSFSPDEKSIAAIFSYNLYYKNIKD